MTDSRKRKMFRFCIYHGVALIVLLFMFFVYRCPLYQLFHIPCPGCGIIRAHFAAFRLDFESAFKYHPLFFVVAPAVLYIAHKNRFKKKLSDKAEGVLFLSMMILFVAVYIFRVSSGDLLFDI